MKDKRYERKNMDSILRDGLPCSKQLMDFIARNYEYHAARIEVLEGILSQMGTARNQKVKDDIYLYGSMIRGQDLAARQMFLWLIALAEETEQARGEQDSRRNM